ncbi:MAG: hypothetical protein HDQ95_09200 [Roseburia sp.]|nr:hypothetical protein [Roseburia sp.]
MFKENDNMRPGPTPERVLAICRLVNQGNYSSQDLFKLSELDPDSKFEEEAIRRSVEAAEELKLIMKSGDKYLINIPDASFKSATAFRKAISPIIFANKKSTFFRLTEWYIANSDMTQEINRFDDFAAMSAKNGIESISENDVLGWRFWMRFLGHAYQYNKTLIPNMKVRLGDALEAVEPGTKMTAVQFVTWLKENVPEAAASCTNQGLSLAVSNGLRTLHEEGTVELISTMDAAKVGLFKLVGVSFNDFSEIIIKGA